MTTFLFRRITHSIKYIKALPRNPRELKKCGIRIYINSQGSSFIFLFIKILFNIVNAILFIIVIK